MKTLRRVPTLNVAALCLLVLSVGCYFEYNAIAAANETSVSSAFPFPFGHDPSSGSVPLESPSTNSVIIETQAKKLAWRLFEESWLRNGDSWYAFDIKDEGLLTQVMNPVIGCFSSPPSLADKLNGVQWLGTFSFTCEVYKRHKSVWLNGVERVGIYRYANDAEIGSWRNYKGAGFNLPSIGVKCVDGALHYKITDYYGGRRFHKPNLSEIGVDAGLEKVKEKNEEPKSENTTNEVAIIATSEGDIVMEFWADVAPNTVENFKKLARAKFYDGTAFHRIIKGFMVQGGDPLTKDTSKEAIWGTGDPGYKIKAEFNSRPHRRGVVSMARLSDPNSAGCQFFICHGDASFLDQKYTAFGNLIRGDDVLEKIANTPTGGNGGEKSKPRIRIEVKSIKIVPRNSLGPLAGNTQ